MTEKPNDQDAQNSCAAEIFSIPQEEGLPCTYCADEHPQTEQQPAEQPTTKKPRRRKAPSEAPPPKKKGNWFSQLSFPWKIVATVCALLSALGLGKCCADMPKQSPGTGCSQSTNTPSPDGAMTVAQADQKGNFAGHTTYQYETVNGVKQLVSAKRVNLDGKLTASLSITRDSSGAACLVQMATYDNDGKVIDLYSNAFMPNSVVLEKEFDLWIYFGQLN